MPGEEVSRTECDSQQEMSAAAHIDAAVEAEEEEEELDVISFAQCAQYKLAH